MGTLNNKNMQFSKYNFTTVTITNASPAVFTSTAHELYTDDEIILNTTGTLPTGLTASDSTSTTKYYVIANGITANTFQVSDTPGGTAINTTSNGSGTHSYLKVNRARLSGAYHDTH